MAAVAALNDEEPPAAPVIVPASTFPVTVEFNRKKDECAEVGDQISDGTFYLGRFRSPDGTEKKWYASAEDASDENGNMLSLDFNQAAQYAANSKAHGHTDWIVPPGDNDPYEEPDIMREIFNNRAKIGGFAEGYHWTSTANYGCTIANYLSFDSGLQTTAEKINTLYVRCVRSVPV